MNDNVLFEIAFSIARKKPIWLIMDRTLEESYRKWEQLSGLIGGLTYVSYTNDSNIVDKFISGRPYEGVEVLSRLLVNYLEDDTPNYVLLYLKQQVVTVGTREIDSIISDRQIPIVLDDPEESKIQNLSWYVQKLSSSVAVLAELSSQNRSGSALQNMKCSFVSGLALGLGKRVMMIAEQPYKSPSDYRDLVKTYSYVSKIERNIRDFLNNAKTEAVQLYAAPKAKPKDQRKETELQTISFGEWIAEHEQDKIFDYYVQTKHISSLIKNEHNIIVGRKGCGKTASFYYLGDAFSSDVRNVVCIIKPNSFEIDALLSLLRQAQEKYQKNYLIETSWKFLIYTEIARALYEKATARPSYALTETEQLFIEYVQARADIILSDFSTRLEYQLTQLQNGFEAILTGTQDKFKARVSETLHNTTLYEIRDFIADLAPKSGRIVVLIDNLDKSWKVNNDLDLLSDWVLGLLSVSGKLSSEISYIKKRQTNVRFSLTIFLRTDILKRVIQGAREPDKIEKTELKYDDKEILFRILEHRFEVLNPVFKEASVFWDKFITDSAGGEEVRDFVFNRVFPRPRDLLLFIRSAKDTAVARGHHKIEEQDLYKAHELYSDWVLTSLFVENGITQEQMEDFLYHLAGNLQIVPETAILTAMELASIDTAFEDTIAYFIDHLVALSILGREVSENDFVFEYDLNVSKKNKIIASKLPIRRYKLHNALAPTLNLK